MADEGAFDKKLKEQAAQTLFQLVWGWAEKIGERTWEKAAVSRALANYSGRYCDRHGSVKILGLDKPIPLNQIYTRVRVVPGFRLRNFTDPVEMQKAFLEAGRRHSHFDDKNSLDGMKLANETPNLNVLGAPGAGKSTFLRRIGIEAMLAEQPGMVGRFLEKMGLQYNQGRIPVLLELRTFQQSPINLLKAIAEEFSTCGFPNSPRFVEEALKQGKLLVLLDGLDEAPAAMQGEVIDAISAFATKHGKEDDSRRNRFVTSCRTAHYKNAFKQFTDVILADFNDDQIQNFAKNWFAGMHNQQLETAEKFFAELKNARNAGAMELARTPLLLAFLCMTFQHGQTLPPTRATLYHRALEILLREWAAERRIHSGPVHQDLHAELETAMLADFAEALFREERFFFDRARATNHIREFMGRLLNSPKTLDADRVLEAIEVQQGLIVRRADNVYSFSHLTIQEFLTAKKTWDDRTRGLDEVAASHLFERRWNVVFELMAGFNDSDRLFMAMAAQIGRRLGDHCQKNADAREIIDWINQTAPSDGLTAREAAALRLGLLGLVWLEEPGGSHSWPYQVGGPNWPLSLQNVAWVLDPATSHFLRSIADTFIVKATSPTRPTPRERTGYRHHEMILDENFDYEERLADYSRDVENYNKARAKEEKSNQSRREDLVRQFLAREICGRLPKIAPTPDTASSQPRTPESILSEIKTWAKLIPSANTIFEESLTAWDLVIRCKQSSYSLTSAAWDETCSWVLTTRADATDASSKL